MLSEPDLNRVELFLAVAEAGGFTAAAERMGIAKAGLSQQIAKLEAELGTALFVRTTRRVTLTEAGETLFRDAAPLIQSLRESIDRLNEEVAAPSGTLRITAPADHAATVLAPALAAFGERYPDLQIDLLATDQVLDLVRERVDVAIRMGWLRDSSLRATQLARFEQYAVASPAYLARHGLPRHPRDLATHRWVVLSLLAAPLTWRFTHGDGEDCTVRLHAAMRTRTPLSALALVQHGAGIAVLDESTVRAGLVSGDLVRLVPAWALPSGGIYAVYPDSRHVPAKVRAFIGFFREWLEALPHSGVDAEK